MSGICCISNVIFENILSKFSGGAISIENVVADIHCCNFKNITTKNEGGGLFADYSTVSLSKCYFNRCKSTYHENNKYRNAAFLYHSTACVYNNAISFCSYSTKECCDSTIVIHESSFSLGSLNCSYCIGIGGAAGCSFLLASASNGDYINFIEGEGNNMMEMYNEIPLTIKHDNFVNGSKILYSMIWQPLCWNS